MTKRTMTRQLAALSFILLFAACTKDLTESADPGTDPSNNSGNKISKIEYDGGSYEGISYNSNGTVNKITNHLEYGGGNAQTINYSFVYNGSQVTEINGDDGSKFKYSYQNQQVVKTEVFAATGNMIAYYQYTYTNGKLTRTDAFNRLPGGAISTTPTVRYDFEYLGSGNLDKMILYYRDASSGILEKTNEYQFSQYDSKHNRSALFENNPYLPMESFTPNNPLKELHFDANGVLEETVTYTYTYDNDGNPLTRKTVTKATGYPEETENTRFYY